MKSITRWLVRDAGEWFENEIQNSHVILFPLRLFIGLGWLRSGVEKLIDPDWYSGVALNHFFYERIAKGDVAFPFYQLLMEGPYSAHAPMLSKLVMLGELYCGIAILLGLLTRPALIVGIFMNLNFILAGSVSPSAFYIVIQLTLLASAAGQVFGLDSFLLPINPVAWAALQKPDLLERARTFLYLGCSLASGLLMIPVATQIKTVDPAQSVGDPAMLLLILLGLQSLLLLILTAQAAQRVRFQESAAGRKNSNPVPQHPIPEYVVRTSSGRWVQIVQA